jgi:hypothetical protein
MPQQPRYVQLPNGTYLEWPENVTADQFKAKALKVMGQSYNSVQRPTIEPPPGTPTIPKPAPPMQQVRTITGTPFNPSRLGGELVNMEGDIMSSMGHLAGMVPASLHRAAQKIGVIGKGDLYPGEHTQEEIKSQDIPNAVLTTVGGIGEEGPMPATNRTASVSRTITDAINPSAKAMPGYEKALSEHLDKIITTAAQKGITIDSPASLAQAMKTAGETIRSHYYDRILAPFKDLSVDITGVKGYSGQGASPSTATLSQLDARLSQINAELDPKYSKPGVAGQAAVKSTGDLNAEASSIRSVLYSKLGQASGIDPKVIAQTRGSFGSLRKLAEQTQTAADVLRHSENAAKNAPITVNPFSGSKGKQFVVDKAVNAVRGNPVHTAIRKAMSTGAVKPYTLPEPNPAAAAKAPRSAPIRGGSRPIGKVSTPTEAEVAELSNRFKEREAKVLANRNKTLRRPLWEKQHPPQGSVGP